MGEGSLQSKHRPSFQVFQCLLIEGENSGDDALREAQQFVISDEEFEGFLDLHREVSCLVPESNQKVVRSKHCLAHHHTLKLIPNTSSSPEGSTH